MAQGIDLSFIVNLSNNKFVNLYDPSHNDSSKFFITVNGKYGGTGIDFSCNFWPHTYSSHKIETLKRETHALVDSSFVYATVKDISFDMSFNSGQVERTASFTVKQGDRNVSCLPVNTASHELLDMYFYNLIDVSGEVYQKMKNSKKRSDKYVGYRLVFRMVFNDSNGQKYNNINWKHHTQTWTKDTDWYDYTTPVHSGAKANNYAFVSGRAAPFRNYADLKSVNSIGEHISTQNYSNVTVKGIQNTSYRNATRYNSTTTSHAGSRSYWWGGQRPSSTHEWGSGDRDNDGWLWVDLGWGDANNTKLTVANPFWVANEITWNTNNPETIQYFGIGIEDAFRINHYGRYLAIEQLRMFLEVKGTDGKWYVAKLVRSNARPNTLTLPTNESDFSITDDIDVTKDNPNRAMIYHWTHSGSVNNTSWYELGKTKTRESAKWGSSYKNAHQSYPAYFKVIVPNNSEPKESFNFNY